MYLMRRKPFSGWQGYLIGFGLVLIATLAGYFARPFFDPTNAAMLYLLCVVLPSLSAF
jgi:K+-sensing histidine kinase KdpD